MRMIWKFLSFATILSSALATAAAQSSAIDPALLAKAIAGDTASEVLLGECYASGKGVTRNLNLAAKWYRKAADKSDIGGEVHLAALYRDGGKDFPRDMTQAAEWYRKAAEQGDVAAQATLGVLYSIGQGLPHSDIEAYYWLDLAAAVKGPNQQKYAANRQLIGTHLTVDELAEVEERAAKWLAAHPR